jgi:hypothetical protein
MSLRKFLNLFYRYLIRRSIIFPFISESKKLPVLFFSGKLIQLHTDGEHDIPFQDQVFTVFKIRIGNHSSDTLVLIQYIIDLYFGGKLFLVKRISQTGIPEVKIFFKARSDIRIGIVFEVVSEDKVPFEQVVGQFQF